MKLAMVPDDRSFSQFFFSDCVVYAVVLITLGVGLPQRWYAFSGGRCPLLLFRLACFLVFRSG